MTVVALVGALACAITAIPIWRSVRRDFNRPLHEADVIAAGRPHACVDVMAYDTHGDPNPDRPYEESVMRRKFPEDYRNG